MATQTPDKSETLEGPEPIQPEGNRLIDGPEPQNVNGKYHCPLCSSDFNSMQLYWRHAHDEHKVGTSTSTVIYQPLTLKDAMLFLIMLKKLTL